MIEQFETTAGDDTSDELLRVQKHLGDLCGDDSGHHEVLDGATQSLATLHGLGQEAVELLENSEQPRLPEMNDTATIMMFNSCDGDARTKMALDWLQRASEGVATVDDEMIGYILTKVPYRNLESLASSWLEESPNATAVTYLIKRASTLPYGEEDQERAYSRAHILAASLLERQAGQSILYWRDAKRQGKELPEAVHNYLDKDHGIASLAFGVVAHRHEQSLRGDRSDSSRAHLEQAFRGEVVNCVMYGFDISECSVEQQEQRELLAARYLRGDLMGFGLESQQLADDSWFVEFNQNGIISLLDYIRNLEALGPERFEQLHRVCGIVNFDRYSAETLRAQCEILDTPQPGRELTIMVSGQRGDHNGAFRSLNMLDLKDTVMFEVDSSLDIMAKVQPVLKQLQAKYTRLTICGHGQKNRIHVSSNYSIDTRDSLGDNGIKSNPIGRLIERFDAIEDIVLYSCSQGKSRTGTARTFSETFPDKTIHAAPAPMNIVPVLGGEAGDVAFLNTIPDTTKLLNYYEIVPIPVLLRAIKFLDKVARNRRKASEKGNYFGAVKYSNGKKEKTDGKVRIGA